MRSEFIGMAAVALAVAGCSGINHSRAVERWHNFEPATVVSPPAPLASLVIFREEGAISGTAVNIFQNGEYLTSLLPGGYKQSHACPGANRLTAHFTDIRTRYLEKERQGQTFQFTSGTVSYFRVTQGPGGAPVLQAMDEQQAQAIVRGLKVQANSLPRVEGARSCMTQAAVAGDANVSAKPGAAIR